MQKIFNLFVFFIVILIAVIFITVNYRGKSFFEQTISEALNRPTTIKNAQVILPLGFRFTSIKIEGLLSAVEARVKVNIPKLLTGKLELNSVELIYPQIYAERTIEGNILLGGKIIRSSERIVERDSTGDLVVQQATWQEETTQINLMPQPDPDKDFPNEPSVIEFLYIKDGQILFVDHKNGGKKWDVDHVEVMASNIPLNRYPVDTDFEIFASLANTSMPFVGHKLYLKGWLNWAKKNMDASIDVEDKDGNMGLSAQAFSEDDNLEVSGSVSISGRGNKRPEAKSKLEDAIFGALTALKADLNTTFKFKTSLSRFELTNIQFGGNFSTSLDENSSKELIQDLKQVGENLQKSSKMEDDQPLEASSEMEKTAPEEPVEVK